MTEAVFGLVGVLIGSAISWFQSYWLNRQETKKSAQYLAVRVVCVFDKYLEDCVSVVKDDGLSCGQRTPDGCLEAQVLSLGAPVFPDDVDWKSISNNLMYEILSFPSDVEAADKSIAFISDAIATPPDYEEFFEERAFCYAQFGLRAHELARKLRTEYNITAKKYENWNPVSELDNELKKIKETRLQKAKDAKKFVEVA